MKRILLMVFRNIIFVPYWFCQLLWYAAHTDSIPEEKKLALLKKIVVHANAGGNVTVKAYGTEHIPRDGSFMFYPNHQGLYDVLAIIDTCPRLFSVVMKKELLRIENAGECSEEFLETIRYVTSLYVRQGIDIETDRMA